MKDALEFLKGKKTYLQAAAGAVVMGLYFAGVIDSTMMGTAITMLGLGMGASIGAKVDRAAKR